MVLTPPPIRVRGASVKYGEAYGIRDVDLDLAPGEILGVIGPSGAGKTSLVECIEGLRKRSSGEISVFGFDPADSRSELASRIGVQLQDTSYPTRSRVRELCALFTSFYDNPRASNELLEQFGLSEKRNAYVNDLSGGEAQKLSLVLALIGRPDLLLLDELTTGLDPTARRATWDMLRDLNDSGTSIVLTSHFMDEVEALCDQVILLVDGRVRTRGTVGYFIDLCADSHHYFLDENLANLFDLDELIALDGIVSGSCQGRRVRLQGKFPEAHESIKLAVAGQGADPNGIRHRPPNMEDAFICLTGLTPGAARDVP